MDFVAWPGAIAVSRGRSAACLLGLVSVVVLRISRLPVWESLAAHTAAMLAFAFFPIAVGYLSVLLAVRVRTVRLLSVSVVVLAAISLVLQPLKLFFAADGHQDLMFEDHILVTPRESLLYYNMPLVLTYTADILLWLACLLLSAMSTAAFKRSSVRRSVS
ncbi:hypothetical protein [Nocardia mexicana]|uniref:hypothetical protein n=1 Tax=Nocardia mexicana TaxID=279262 RepID=UPI0011C05B9C|nr:hypothetical protein [Nocardia mexicana]